MLDKEDFYHGVVLIKILEDSRFHEIKRSENGYLVNGNLFIFIKYTTKSRSPWRFTFSDPEIHYLNRQAGSIKNLFLALVCGGDGICPVSWKDGERILNNKGGWIAVNRKFNQSYGVSGPFGMLAKKVPVQQWPSILFDE